MEKSWRRLGKEELEHQYSPSHWSHRMDINYVIEAHVKETTEGTKKSRAMAQTILNIQYGDRDSEKMDFYLPNGESTKFPLLVYIHGGYWQFLSKEESGFMVLPLVSHGIAVMVMDYDIAPKGDMDLIVSQVRCSIAAVLRFYPQNSGVYLCGHSAGAHLAAIALCTDWKEYGVAPDVKGAFLVSGVYDLLPIIHTYVNDALKMSQEVALKNSPIQYVRQMNAGTCPVVIAVAEHDSPEFHRQSQNYFQMAAAGFIHCPSGNSPDVAQCFFCLKELEGWEPEDDPMEEHKKHSPSCLFITLKKKAEELTVGEFLKLDKERAKIKMNKRMNQQIEKFQTAAQTVRKLLETLDKDE